MAATQPQTGTHRCWGRTRTMRRCKLRLNNKWFCENHRWQSISFAFACLCAASAILTIHLWFDETGKKLLAAQAVQEKSLNRIVVNGAEVLQGQNEQSQRSDRIEAKIDELLHSNKYVSKYPLGYCVFYADGSSDIRRVGKLGDVKVYWEDVELSSDSIELGVAMSGQRGQSAMAGTMFRTFGRQVGTYPFAIVLDNTELVLEIVENRDTGVVCVFGLRPSLEQSDNAKVGLRL